MISTAAFIPLSRLEAVTNLTGLVFNSSATTQPVGLAPSVQRGYAAQVGILSALVSSSASPAIELMADSRGSLGATLQHPLSRGTVRPSSRASPFDPPVVDPRFCAAPPDCAVLLAGARFGAALTRTSAMRLLAPQSSALDAQTMLHGDDAAAAAFLRDAVGSGFHPAGSAAMMPLELGGVVDPCLRVYGVAGLRVVDAAVMPLIPSAHLQAAVYAIAEKVSSFIHAQPLFFFYF